MRQLVLSTADSIGAQRTIHYFAWAAEKIAALLQSKRIIAITPSGLRISI
jgi:hypothetical protein